MKPRLLVVELHHLGDAVMSLPFVRGAQTKFEVHVVCRQASCAIYESMVKPPIVHEWEPPWVDDRPCGAWQAVTAARDEGRILRPLDFAAAACVWADVRAGILASEARAAQRVGFPMTRGNYYAADLPWRRQLRWSGVALEILWRITHPGQPLLTRRLYRESPDQPHSRCWEQIAAALEIPCDYTIPWIRADRAGDSARGSRPVLAIHANARLPSKQWSVDRWRDLLAAPEVKHGFELIEIVPAGAAGVTANDVRKIHTPDLSALVSALDSADAVLCHDSFPAHLAAAMGKPVVTIFGSGESDWFAPWNNRGRAVFKRVCPMHPCIDRCGMDRYLCLDAIEIEDVLAQLRRLNAET